MKTDNAYPNDPHGASGGLTKRERFALAAMQGLLSQHASQECDSGARDLEPVYAAGTLPRCARDAVRMADLLMTELNKPSEIKAGDA